MKRRGRSGSYVSLKCSFFERQSLGKVLNDKLTIPSLVEVRRMLMPRVSRSGEAIGPHDDIQHALKSCSCMSISASCDEIQQFASP